MQEKMRKILKEGEGHTIFKTSYVVEALKESGYAVTTVESKGKKRSGYVKIVDKATGNSASASLIYPPTHAPRSKYDIVSWDDNMDTGVHDLQLISALTSLTGKPYDGGDFLGRGFQYRAYYGWLQNQGLLPKEDTK